MSKGWVEDTYEAVAEQVAEELSLLREVICSTSDEDEPSYNCYTSFHSCNLS